MTPKEEQHVHLEECIWSLNEAWRILKELRATTQKTALHAAAFRYALVAYTRPYTRSDCEHRKGRNAYLLPDPKLTPHEVALHEQILNLRHQVLAHSDLTIKQAAVYVGRCGDKPRTIIASNSLPAFPEIDAVISLIERTLDLLYAQRTQSEEEMAPSA
jgi:hypothetical protein